MRKIWLSFSLFVMALISTFSVNASSIDPEFNNWTNIGGNSSNSKVTYANTIKSEADIEKRIAITGGFRDAIIVDDIIYSVNKTVLEGYDLDGNKVKSITLPEAPGFFSRLTSDGEGTVFVALSKSIMAVDVKNDKTLWQSETSAKQVLTQIVYHDGYVYAGAVTKASASQVPSDGYYFAIDTAKDDPSQTNEIIPYAWTWKMDDQEGNGFYWDGAAIVKNAIVIAGDRGLVVSHHLKKDYVYDEFDLSTIHDDANKIRSSINYNAYKDEVLLVTQNSKAMFKLKMNGNKFDKENVKYNLAAADQMTGGPAISKNEKGNLYAPSGGMYANSFTIYDADTLTQKFTTKAYGTQSYPLLNVASADGYEYAYFIDYKSGDLIIAKYDGKNDPTFSQLKLPPTGNSPTYNSGGPVVASDGTIVVTKHDGGAMFIIKPKTHSYTVEQMDTVIEKLADAEALNYYDKDQVKQVYHQYTLTQAANDGYTNEKIVALNSKVDELSDQKVVAATSELDSVLQKEKPTLAELEKALAEYGKLYPSDKTKVTDQKYDKTLHLQLHILLEDEIAKLPVGDDIKLSDYKKINNVMNNYNNSPQEVKDMVSATAKAKLDAAYEIAQGFEAQAKKDAAELEAEIVALPQYSAVVVGDAEAINAVVAKYEKAPVEVLDLIATTNKTKMANLIKKVSVLPMDEKIAALPAVSDVTLADKENVLKINDEYNAIDSALRAYVNSTLKTKLTDLVNKVKALQVEADIMALPSVENLKFGDKAAVTKAGADYTALTTNQKNYVSAEAKAKLTSLQNRMTILEAEAKEQAQTIEDAINALPEIMDITLADQEAIAALASDYNDLEPAVQELIDQLAVEKLKAAQDKISALEFEIVINELPKVKDLTLADQEALQAVLTQYQALSDGTKGLINEAALDNLLALSQKMELLLENESLKEDIKDLEDQAKELAKPVYKKTSKGNTTYYYRLNNAREYNLYKKVIKTSTQTTTADYRTTGDKKISNKRVETSKNNKLVQKDLYKYNTKGKVTSKKVYKLNDKKSFVLTAATTKTYFKNLTSIKTNKVIKKNLKGKDTAKTKTTYTSKGKKAKHVKYAYAKPGSVKNRLEYKYNSKGQLKSNKAGKAYRYVTTYKNGKATKTTKKTYNAKGKLSSTSVKVKLRVGL